MTRAEWRVALRVQRFEVVAVVVVAGVVAILAVITRLQLDGVGVSQDCLKAFFASGGVPGDTDCEARAKAFSLISEGMAGRVMAAMALVPFAIGLGLGVTVVARDIEGGTAPTVWALAGSRLRWLAGRGLPIGAVLVVAMIILAVTSEFLWAGREPWEPPIRLNDAGLHGAIPFAKGLAMFGIAVVLGAFTGRALPAMILAIGIATLLYIGDGLAYHGWQDAEMYRHVVDVPADGQTDARVLFPGGLSTTGFRTPAGEVLIRGEAYLLVPAGADPTEWFRDHLQAVVAGVPGSSYLDWQLMATSAFASIALGGAVLTIPVVQRRRPV